MKMPWGKRQWGAKPDDFAPDLLAIQQRPPASLPRAVGLLSMGLFGVLLAWGVWGQLDIVASAEGRLVPRNYTRVLQPAEAGIVREVLVREGERVKPGQVLLRLDATTASADLGTLKMDASVKALSLRRIDAELQGKAFLPLSSDPPEVAMQVMAQYRARRQSYEDAVALERAALEKAEHDLVSAEQTLRKLQAVLPHYQRQSESYQKLVKDGFVSELGASDKVREGVEKEQEYKAQLSVVAGLKSAVAQSQKKLSQIRSNYEAQLRNERLDILNQQQKAQGDLDKQVYKSGLLELRAETAGYVKDLLTTTPGAVVQPGAVLLNLVPLDEPLLAEVAIRNEDVGFVIPGQAVQIKLQAYPFQKYGLLPGVVQTVGADSAANEPQKAAAMGQSPQSYRALVTLAAQELRSSAGEVLKLAPGMVVQAEIQQGKRSVLEYLLSPVKKVAHEAGRER